MMTRWSNFSWSGCCTVAGMKGRGLNLSKTGHVALHQYTYSLDITGNSNECVELNGTAPEWWRHILKSGEMCSFIFALGCHCQDCASCENLTNWPNRWAYFTIKVSANVIYVSLVASLSGNDGRFMTKLRRKRCPARQQRQDICVTICLGALIYFKHTFYTLLRNENQQLS